MIYLLDTNACIRYLRSPISSVAQKVAATSPDAIAISAITVVELVRGAYRSARMQENLNQVQAMVAQFMCLPLDQMVATHAGRIDAELMVGGLRIGPYDTLIAATALAHNLTLVTHNTGEFSRVVGLRLEDWEA
ncbi:type II toxin-antitoxin system VapC family toxin [Candidatus Chloroploca asiatica]|uniref:Ribonuclease VapC n=1 Tax=Candidatus Chloroploca asiatica TaxID=1506545 RepID=A0A2H3KPI2_9CHLR|nr:type II toxin-antitoxin system VapC family toxin [Candidatus Chloroploca asiatica]NCC32449.1 type II toxin-antitoxin system VapC family toxin [Chloroflexia bacterium]PDW00177.1 twitching motility protein PilT [Candidatus Chloroploca asiatica]